MPQQLSPGEVEIAAREFIASAGQEPPQEIAWNADRIQRYYIEGDKKGSKNGWYRAYLDEHPTIVFGSFKTGVDGKFRFNREGFKPSEEDKAKWRELNAKREARAKELESNAAILAKKIIDGAWAAEDDHPYLVKKNIKSNGLSVITRADLKKIAPDLEVFGRGDILVMPLKDSGGKVWSVQFITPAGDKIFLKDGRTDALYFSIGRPKMQIVLCEGFATGATLHEATGDAVAVALNSGNLPKVAKAIRGKHPKYEYVIAADNDEVGQKYAKEASECIQARIVTPPTTGADWNDMAAENGLKSVTDAIDGTERVNLVPHIPDPTPPEDGFDLALGANGQPYANIDNAVRIMESIDEFKGKIWFDEFFHRIFVEFKPNERREWADSDEIQIALYVQKKIPIPHIKTATIKDAATHIAMGRTLNEPKSWMEGLVWDGIARLDMFFPDGYGTPETHYYKKAGKNFILGIVARTFQPGCKLDTMPVFEGPQGTLKSSSLEAIASKQFYAETSESVDKKDFYLGLPGKLIVEISELDSFRKAEVTSIKKMLSCHTDRYRAPYGRTAQDFPRRSVFAGTTNQNDWLSDPTGGRRFWPISCGEIDLKYIICERAQLFAEAVKRFKSGESWWDMPEEETAHEQSMRLEVDSWQESIVEWINRQPLNTEAISVHNVLFDALKIDTGKHTRVDQMRVGKILRGLGYTKSRKLVGGGRAYFWTLEENE
jgi:predicted P-loop ATPase/phage/plasmid primase-like uncharacterized protein